MNFIYLKLYLIHFFWWFIISTVGIPGWFLGYTILGLMFKVPPPRWWDNFFTWLFRKFDEAKERLDGEEKTN